MFRLSFDGEVVSPSKRGSTPNNQSGRKRGGKPKPGDADRKRRSTGTRPPAGGRRGGRPRAAEGDQARQRRSGSGRGLGGDQVEGRQAVRELLLARTRPVKEILMVEGLDDAPILSDIRELAGDLKVPLKSVTRKRFDADALTMSHQGVLAKAKPLQEKSLESLLSGAPFLLVLDGLTDPQNLGAIIRTAECAGVTGIVMPRHRAVHVTATVTKTAAGAIEHMPMALVGGIPTAIKDLSDAGVLTVGLDADGETALFDLDLSNDRPVALVLGAEGSGLSRLVRQRVDVVASLPLRGELNSLNVAMAGAAACFEVVRQRTPKPRTGS
ncbi:MAG: 23S rRNA (guanosine(2251)-2'-O)-methyltransferase RlmB [Acidimicrobiales bacterium]